MIWKGNRPGLRQNPVIRVSVVIEDRATFVLSRENKPNPKLGFSKGRAISLAESKANPTLCAKARIRVPRPGRRKPNLDLA